MLEHHVDEPVGLAAHFIGEVVSAIGVADLQLVLGRQQLVDLAASATAFFTPPTSKLSSCSGELEKNARGASAATTS